jgi:hypothetical protein
VKWPPAWELVSLESFVSESVKSRLGRCRCRISIVKIRYQETTSESGLKRLSMYCSDL